MNRKQTINTSSVIFFSAQQFQRSFIGSCETRCAQETTLPGWASFSEPQSISRRGVAVKHPHLSWLNGMLTPTTVRGGTVSCVFSEILRACVRWPALSTSRTLYVFNGCPHIRAKGTCQSGPRTYPWPKNFKTMHASNKTKSFNLFSVDVKNDVSHPVIAGNPIRACNKRVQRNHMLSSRPQRNEF